MTPKAGNDQNLRWRQIKENVIFRNKYIGLRVDKVQAPDGNLLDYAVIENRDFASVVCVTDDKKILFVRQFRYPWQAFSYEIPSGLLEEGEDPKQGVIRELREETGYSVDSGESVKFMTKSHAFGLTIGWCYTYFTRTTQKKPQELNLDPEEFLQVFAFTKEEVLQMLEAGEIIHSPTILAINTAIAKGFL